MARVFTKSDVDTNPTLDKEKVLVFFEERSKKSKDLGSIQAVIYQDKNPNIAIARDKAEKDKLIPIMKPLKHFKVLDLGCGTGRWLNSLYHPNMKYVGVDFCQGLIDIAQDEHQDKHNARFIVSPIDTFHMEEHADFDLILCLGLFIYLNDDELNRTFDSIARMASNDCTLVIREPIATHDRLSIIDHYSNDMDQVYNAIYRTRDNFLFLFDKYFFSKGFHLIDEGNMYEDKTLNNREETIQYWFKLRRSL